MENSVNQRIKIFAEKKGLTNALLAKALGISPAGLSNLLTGKSKPHKSTLRNLIETYSDLNEDWLFTGDGEMLKDSSSKIDWKEEAFNAVKEENTFLKKQLELLNNVVNTLLKNPNFLNGSLQAAKLIEIQGALAGDYKLAA